jgi:hypothetical protein
MDIFLSAKPTVKHLSSLFEVDLPVVVLEDWDDERARDFGSVHTVILAENRSEFPYGLSFQEQTENQESWLLSCARKLSVELGCRVLYTGNPVQPDNPFFCVVFDSGQAFLADDEGSILAEGQGGPVKILRRLPELDASLA